MDLTSKARILPRPTRWTICIARMRHALADDPSGMGVFDHILADSDREEAQAALGIDAARYDTARRRMARHLFNAFHAGWNL